ncbi:family 43 glycosylhydrolase [Chitinophagaceae bacterium LB-8]|uniref:Family 43 glycosylhydrolase n=1 Tax=Paraflavisolibacter caeni TaxID=2982496 RepID=A0A9X2Y0C0_9BACT|nr:family 43 glycosylhydrolase [Paraflavisolibacter caeni]MCU7552207.1 family 43 glycosylhydrolase [Paraflavisolibacter caeni]
MTKLLWALAFTIAILATAQQATAQQATGSFCNPLNLNYRFSYDSPAYREAADPVMHIYKGKYFLYASKSGGYWYSDDMLNWVYRPSTTLPVEDYAPTVETIHDTAFFIASKGKMKIYYSTNPLEDNWKVYNSLSISMTDPALFKDDDGRVYFYYGCSSKDPIMGIELDPKRRLDTIGSPLVLIQHNFKKYGWEEHGELNNNGKDGWNEGSWMNKHNGKYYLQYAAPGTEFKVYGDGVYVSDKPLGPFTYMPNSPFSYKPSGFINGAGHGCTFKDKYGNYWHIATMAISVRHMFERRLGLFPVFFDADGQLHCNTAFGDYPMQIVNRKMNFEKESLFTGWMLLSYNKPVTASSEMPGHAATMANDEEARSWWCAASGNSGEWLQMDLQQLSTIRAIQVNFADEGARLKAGMPVKPYQYSIAASSDGKQWKLIADKTANTVDVTHDYIVLPQSIKARFVKITNHQVPDGAFSLSGFRIFGKGNGKAPQAVKEVSVQRDASDTRRATIQWKPSPGATGYVIYFGNEKTKLYHSVMLYGKNTLDLPGLNKDVPYFFRVDAFNENGITKGN